MECICDNSHCHECVKSGMCGTAVCTEYNNIAAVEIAPEFVPRAYQNQSKENIEEINKNIHDLLIESLDRIMRYEK